MSILSEDFDLTPQDIIKNVVVKLLTKYDDDPNNVKIIWESCDWPRILKRPERNIVYYMKTCGGELYIRIKDRKKVRRGVCGYRYLDKMISICRMPITIEEILIKNEHELA